VVTRISSSLVARLQTFRQVSASFSENRGDLLGGALLGRIVLLAVDGEAVVLVPEDEAVAAGVLLPPGSVVPKAGEIAPHRRVVPGQDDVGVGVPAESGRRELFGGEAAADLVPPLEDADAHAAVLDEIQREQERLVSATDDHGVEGLVSQWRLLSESRYSQEFKERQPTAKLTRSLVPSALPDHRFRSSAG